MPARSKPKERRSQERRPIRLKVVFRTARSLVTEYTTSVSKGGCRIQSKQPLEVGTRFVFEMHAKNSKEPVEIDGRVSWCAKAEPDGYEIGIEYLPMDGKRGPLEGVLEEIFAEHRYEKARLHPRIPVNLVARDSKDAGLKYLIRDISRGGLGLRFPSGADLPAHIKPRAFVMLLVRFEQEDPVEVGGEVVWTVEGRSGFTRAAVGVAFLGIGVSQQEAIDSLTQLRRPAELTLTFGPRG